MIDHIFEMIDFATPIADRFQKGIRVRVASLCLGAPQISAAGDHEDSSQRIDLWKRAIELSTVGVSDPLDWMIHDYSFDCCTRSIRFLRQARSKTGRTDAATSGCDEQVRYA
jgi:hypothetical protein